MGVSADGLYRSGNGTLALLSVSGCKRKGKKMEGDSYNSMGMSEEEEWEIGEGGSKWEQVRRGEKGRKASEKKRKKNDKESLESTESEGQGEEVNSGKKESLNVVVRFDGEGGIKKMDPLTITKIIRTQVGEVKYAKVLGDGNLLIGCNTETQVEKARKMVSIGKMKVTKTVKVGEQNRGCKGVITGVPLGISTKTLVGSLKVRNAAVKDVKRMTRGPEKKESETVVVEFDTKTIPRELYFGFVKYNVREFVPKPMRCFNCQEYGHIAKLCKGKRRCARCGGDHEYGKCGTGVKPKCCNCGGEHSVAYWGCEAMRREITVQRIKVSGKVSYAEAVKRAGQENVIGNQQNREKQMMTSIVRDTEKKMLEEKKRLVTFIAGVINATADVKSKTERIQIIVKAAAHHLDMKGIRWEEVRDELSIQASQETTCIG